ncbi:HAMP domain-containing sensor histidine kinase [Hymenobacter arcticus]
MNLKTKITVGFLAVLLLLAGVGAYTLYSLKQLDRSAINVLKDNLYSVELGQQLTAALDQLAPAQQQHYLTATAPAGYDATVRQGLGQFRRALTREAGNITEPGEREVVDSLTRTFSAYQQLLAAPVPERPTDYYFARVLPQHQLLRAQTARMVQLNLTALTRKNEASARQATQVIRYTLAMLVFSGLVILFFVLSVPESAVTPLRRLLASIDQANRQDFSSTIEEGGRDELGQVARAFNRLLGQLQDYRTSTLAQLTAERNRVASVVNTLDEGLLLVDENRRIIVANPVISSLLGLPVEQLVGRAADELAQQNTLFGQLLPYLDTPAAQRAQQNAVFTLSQHGEEAYFRLLAHDVLSFNPALDKLEFTGSVLTLRNVSEYKKLDQAKWHFLAQVSQGLQTPLAGMQLSLKRLQEGAAGSLTPEQQNITYTLARENKQLLKVVGELLDVSRLELGTIQLNFQGVRLHTLVQFVADTIQPQLQPKRLVLDVQVPDTLPAVRADLEKTTWVLLSLLANAIRYSHMQDHLRIEARLAGAGQLVRVSVHDQGPGIDPANQDKIFQRFAQIPTQGGSGLGLSIAREFVASQGGELGVESVVGQGSTFWFTLPLAGPVAA